MKTIKVTKDCKYQDNYLYQGDVLVATKNNLEMIKKLNTKGFIEPLNERELNEIEKSVKRQENKKEEDINA